MVERAGRLRFAKQAPLRDGVPRCRWRDELERDLAVQALVLGDIDHTHSPGANLLEDPVVRDEGPEEGIQCAAEYNRRSFGA